MENNQKPQELLLRRHDGDKRHQVRIDAQVNIIYIIRRYVLELIDIKVFNDYKKTINKRDRHQ